MSNSSPSRFDLSFANTEKPLPPLPSEEASLEQLAAEICEFDSDLTEILFSATFSNQTREEKLAKIQNWAAV